MISVHIDWNSVEHLLKYISSKYLFDLTHSGEYTTAVFKIELFNKQKMNVQTEDKKGKKIEVSEQFQTDKQQKTLTKSRELIFKVGNEEFQNWNVLSDAKVI